MNLKSAHYRLPENKTQFNKISVVDDVILIWGRKGVRYFDPIILKEHEIKIECRNQALKPVLSDIDELYDTISYRRE